jgi:hypothetical protein
MAGPIAFESQWDEIRASLERHRDDFTASYQEAWEEAGLIHTALVKIGQLIQSSTLNNGNGAAWKRLPLHAESEKAVLSKHLDGKPMLTAILRLYTATFREMSESAVQEPTQPNEKFHEQRRRKRIPSHNPPHAKKSSGTAVQLAPP